MTRQPQGRPQRSRTAGTRRAPAGQSPRGGRATPTLDGADDDLGEFADLLGDELTTTEGTGNPLVRRWRLLPRALRYLWPYKPSALVSIVMMVGLALVALAQPWPLAFVLDSVIVEDKAPPGWVTFIAGDTTSRLIVFAVGALLAITLLNGIFSIISQFVQTRLEGLMGLDFRSDLFEHLQRLSFSFHDNIRTGVLMYRLNNQAGGFSQLIVSLPKLGQSILTLLGMAIVAVQINAQLALLAFVVVPPMYYSTLYYGNRIEPTLLRVRAMEGRSLAIVHEAIAMLRVVVAFGREKREFNRFRRQSQKALDARVSLTVRQTAFKLAINLITAIGTAAVLGVGALKVLDGQISVGELTVIMTYIAAIHAPMQQMADFFTQSQQQFLMFEYALRILEHPVEVADSPNAKRMARAKGDVTFDRVTFAYDDNMPALYKVSFHVEPGQVVGLVGPTGAGKSTLLSLLPRFYDPQAGRVFIDGRDVRDITVDTLRRQFSIVLQEPLLFSGAIAENIRYGRARASQEEIEAAARAAGAHDFITRLDQGYDTPLGERGAKLSGGERQRIAIARAFLRDSPILLLDEPTSAIDSKTEAVVLEALERLMKGRTTFVVAHRLSTIRNCDLILVLNMGMLVEQGTHEELMRWGGIYHQLWEAQNGSARRTNGRDDGQRPHTPPAVAGGMPAEPRWPGRGRQ
jgi:ATP-binding cassette, subfamily B, bacterial